MCYVFDIPKFERLKLSRGPKTNHGPILHPVTTMEQKLLLQIIESTNVHNKSTIYKL